MSRNLRKTKDTNKDTNKHSSRHRATRRIIDRLKMWRPSPASFLTKWQMIRIPTEQQLFSHPDTGKLVKWNIVENKVYVQMHVHAQKTVWIAETEWGAYWNVRMSGLWAGVSVAPSRGCALDANVDKLWIGLERVTLYRSNYTGITDKSVEYKINPSETFEVYKFFSN